MLQAAFAWSDSHLHRFSLGGGPFDRHSELFLCPFDVEEGDDGSPASAVRLDETLQEPGDVLRYVYDYGDSWELTLRLEEVRPADASTPAALCVGGRRAAPPEDCGGLTDADELVDVLDDPAHFDAEEINQALRDPYVTLREHGVPPRLLDLANRLQHTPVGHDVVVRVMSLASPVPEPDTDNTVAALRAHQWFLDRAGEGGIELTAAGYLKPDDVEAAAALVPAMADWIGKKNREINCHAPAPLPAVPAVHRAAAQVQGQAPAHARRCGGAAGTRGAVRHLAGRLVPSEPGTFAEEATVLLLAYAATGTELPLGRVAEALTHLGWRVDDQPVMTRDLYGLEVLDILRNVSSRPVTFRDRNRVDPVAAALARAALREMAA